MWEKIFFAAAMLAYFLAFVAFIAFAVWVLPKVGF